jgi:hypothetical protein
MKKEKKYIFPKKEQKKIFQHFRKYVDRCILPDQNIGMIILLGSLLKGKMGKYEKFHKLTSFKRLYSDIDLEMFVNDKFKPRKSWKLISKHNQHVSYYKITTFENKFPVICRVRKKIVSNKIVDNYKSKRNMKVIYKK